MMNKLLRRLLSGALAAALMAGMCLTASAADFKYPQAYWALQDEWVSAQSAGNPDAVITAAQKIYDLLYPMGLGQSVCENLEPKSMLASWACENKGDIAGAITWAERQYTFAKWLTDSGLTKSNGQKYDYTDQLQNIECRLSYLRAAQNVVVYARSNNGESPYPVGPRTGTWYGTPAGSTRTDTDATLMYITFNDGYSVEYWINYCRNTSENFRKAENGGVIELAWNFAPESTAGAQAVLSADSYIAEGLKAMGSLNATVLLRVGAEMNNWNDCDPEVFKQAFQKIATAARAYPNIQMVYSPNDISNRFRTCESFYPGDEYVDWVGMSTYHKTDYDSYDKSKGTAVYDFSYSSYNNDAFYGVGIYDHDPMITIKPIIDMADKHNKPVMISECGFPYQVKASGRDLTSYAADQMNWFYSYLNMVYPQVKAVFYFDAEATNDAYKYKLSDSPTLNATYETTIRENGAYLSETSAVTTGWQSLDKTVLKGSETTLRLAAYASFPGKHSTTVKYYVDGKEVYTASKAPFYYDLDISGMTPGSHTVKVEAEGGQFKGSSQTYTLRVKMADADPTNDALTADGEVQSPTVYKINGSNYFKIRDLAAILNGSGKQFSVDYDNSLQSVTATTGERYDKLDTDLAGAASGGRKEATISNDVIYIDGEKVEAEVFKIDGSNYFKLRDLGQALDFYVGYESGKGVFIDTTKPYEA